jgi:hypothetical protein
VSAPTPHPDIIPVLTLLRQGAEVEKDTEGGQPNGSGELEPSNDREWFTKDRETHHREVITIYGPWIEGPA